MAIALWPSATIRSASLRTAASFRSTRATAAPASAKASAVARPMPEAAPVTRATLPSNNKFITHSFYRHTAGCRLPRLLCFFEKFPCDRQGGARCRPAGIKGEMGNHLDDFLARHAVLQRLFKVERQLVRPVKRYEAGDSDEAAIAGLQTWPFPNVAEQNVVRVLRQRRCDVAKCFPSIVRHSCYSFALV